MLIGINGRFLSKPFTGIGQYTIGLLDALLKQKNHHRFLVCIDKKLSKKLRGKWHKYIKSGRLTIHYLRELRLVLAGAKKTWWEQIQVPEYFAKQAVDVAFFPYPANPWSSDWKIPTIVAVHDCIPWQREDYQTGILSKLYHHQSKRAVKKADKTVTVSKASAKDIEDLCRTKKEKIAVIYPDASDVYRRGSKKERAEDEQLLKKWGLAQKKYLLYVGGYDKRKNVDYLVDVWRELGHRGKINVDNLVLSGGGILNKELYSSLEKAEATGLVKTGFLAEEQLASLYRQAAGLLHFSEAEGFNIPIVEAANCGTPLFLSDIPVHREVASGAAKYLSLYDIEGAAQQLEKTLNNSSKISDLKRKSSMVANRYSWRKSAEQLMDILEQL